MFKEIRGINYHYYIHSQKPALPYLVMLHGFMGDSGIFDHLIAVLQAFSNPVTIDLIGHGQTDAPGNSQRYELSNQIDDINDLLSQLNLQGTFLLGYSMGGRLALRIALNNNLNLAGLILESTTYGIEDPAVKKDRLRSDQDNADRILNDFHTFVDKWNRNPLFAASQPLKEETQQNLDYIQRRQRPHGLANSLIGFGSASMASVRHQLGHISLPTLLITGQQDVKYSTIGNEMSRHIPDCKHYILAGCGHRVHVDDPNKYVNTIRRFIESQQIVRL
ncbi:MAG TPA: 2-succinyl-6-hydroxy-2,4-cyclohexadiene-1-carboxylate synthase [Balneolales bacterium]|nr:2-succinyl-6-hydroxy-2,4-cyclohexadiene-1-carboxylate synthase [Balneolales bacterium]